MKKLTAFLILFILLFSTVQTGAQDARVPAPAGYVVDEAGILPQNSRLQLEAIISKVERATTCEIAVLTVKTTSPITIEQYAVEVFRKWGIGKKGKDNGVLLMVASGDRKVRIEVGYGLEGAIPDLRSKLIIEDYIVPSFRAGNFPKGIILGVAALSKLIGDEYDIEIDFSNIGIDPAALPARGKKSSPLGSLLTLLFFILIFGFRFGTLFFVMGSGRGNYWSGGGGSSSFGGGFGGFGGGMSGGGGSSGSW